MASTITDPTRDRRFLRLYQEDRLTLAAIARREKVSRMAVQIGRAHV